MPIGRDVLNRMAPRDYPEREYAPSGVEAQGNSSS
jgi:hypothetical protein